MRCFIDKLGLLYWNRVLGPIMKIDLEFYCLEYFYGLNWSHVDLELVADQINQNSEFWQIHSKLFITNYYDMGELDFGDDESVVYLMIKDI